MESTPDKKLLRTSATLREEWDMECPHCGQESDAPFNFNNPGSPMETSCDACGENFIVEYDRDE